MINSKIILGSLVQVPIGILNSYRSGINRGFDTVSSGITGLQTLLSSLGGSLGGRHGSRGSSAGSSSSLDFESNDVRRYRY